MASRGREQLLDRLATFTPARWPGEPLSALECARRGWRLEAGPLLRCSACEAAVPARLPGVGRSRLRAECVSRLRRLVSEGHRAGCRWSAAPLPAVQLRPPLPETAAGRRRLTAGLARLAAAAVPLPSDARPLHPLLESEKTAIILTEALGGEPPYTDRAQTALEYSLAGWELTEDEKYLQCNFGCRTWDTTGRPPPPDDTPRGDKVLTASKDVIQDALDECGLEDLDLELSVPITTEGQTESETDVRPADQGQDVLEGGDALREDDNGGGDNTVENSAQLEQKEVYETSQSSEAAEEPPTNTPEERTALCPEESVEDADTGAAGDAGSGPTVPTGAVGDVGSPVGSDGVSDGAGSSPDDDCSPPPSAPDDGEEAGGSPRSESSAEVGSVPSSPSVLGGGSRSPSTSDDLGDEGVETEAKDRGVSPSSPEDGAGSCPVSAGEDQDAVASSDGGGSAEELPREEHSTDHPSASESTEPVAPSAADQPPTPSTDPDPAPSSTAEQPTTPLGKRPADSPPTASAGVKRARRRPPAGPLDGHRCWCPWVAGVDGGQPGWRQAVAALNSAGRLLPDGGAGGETLWAGDAALDTMRRVWATLDQWTSPPAKSALRA